MALLVCFRQQASCPTLSLSHLLIADLIFGKRIHLIVFRQKFYKNVCLWRTISASRSFEKLIEIKSLNKKQSLAQFPPSVIPSLPNTTPPISPRVYPPLTKRQQNGLALINHSCISPTLQWGWGWGSVFQKNRRVNFPSKSRSYYERIIYDCCLSSCL